MRKKGGSHLSRDPGGRHVPGYPGKISSGSKTPEGYQKEARKGKSKAGSPNPAVKKSGKMGY